MNTRIPVKIKPKICVKFREKKNEKSDKIINRTKNDKNNLTLGK
jgi:hypothetical protein